MVMAFWVGGRAAMETCSYEIRRGVGEVGPKKTVLMNSRLQLIEKH